MLRVASDETRSIGVVDDQIGQPTSALDLAHQVFNMISNNAPPGIYHGTNSGETSWFGLAREVFSIIGADISRLKPIKSSDYPSTVVRPSYSVLSNEKWKEAKIRPMRDWKEALIDTVPSILEEASNLEIKKWT
jgi:dTDP-4-dehydrorhamnose reductase